MDYSYIGKDLCRTDAPALAAGMVQFCADRRLEHMLVAKVYRSNEVHAELTGLDISQAQKIPGVVIATAQDIPGVGLHGIHKLDQPVLVPIGGRVRMQGEPLAVVAAKEMETVEQAFALIRAVYRPLEIIDDPLKACEEGTPTLFPERFAREYEFKRGDVEAAFREADVVIEHTQEIPRQEHAYIEPEAGISYYDHDGILTSFSPSHEPYNIRHQIARMLGLTVGQVRAIVPPLGGSFGGKQNMTVHLHSALITYLTKRPVQMIWTREESMMVSTKRHPGYYRYRIGAKRTGEITAIYADYTLDAGAYTEHSPGVTVAAGQAAIGPYRVPNAEVHGRSVYTNNPISGAFRGYGGPQSNAALERAIHVLAETLGIGQAEIRRINALRMGDLPGNDVMVTDSDVTLVETIDRALAAAGPLPAPSGPGKRVGRGIACGIPQFDVSAKPYNGLTGAGAEVELFFDGTFQVRTAIVEMGTGIRTALAQIVAEEMHVPLTQIDVVLSDTALTPKAGPTVASRAMYCAGNAVKNAVTKLRERMFAHAGKQFGVPAYCIEISNGKIFARGMETHAVTLADFAGSAFVLGENLVAYDWFVGTHAKLGHTFVTTVSDVEVDDETGEVRVLYLGTSHDVGKIINPANVRGQLIGGAVMGQGYALTEEMQAVKGQIVNRTLAEYYIPTALDAADRMRAISIESPYPTGPYGAKGVGEHSMYTVAPAILNAICDAVKINLTTFPATPERVWRAMRKEKKEGEGP